MINGKIMSFGSNVYVFVSSQGLSMMDGSKVKSEEELKQEAKEAEQKKLDAEMQKRKERIEKWRAERKKIMLQEVREAIASQHRPDSVPANLQVAQNPNPDSGKKWSLEDDSSDEDEVGKGDGGAGEFFSRNS
jgi:ATP-dependent RNA helicase DDX46/PRP5